MGPATLFQMSVMHEGMLANQIAPAAIASDITG